MIQNEKVSVYYGTKEAYEFEKQYKRIDENALYFIEGIIYSGYELYSKDYKKVSEFPDIGQSNIIYINTADSSVAIWNEDLNEWIYICRPLNDEIIDDSTTIASSAVVYKILEQSKEYTNSKCKETAETINLNIENSIMENNRNLFLGTSDKYNSIADICNILDGVLSIEETDRYTNEEIDNKFSTLETNIDWKEAVDTFDDILTTYPTPVDGWTVNVKDTDYTYRYNGTEWVVISANAIPKATSSVDGLLSKEDKIKLDGIANTNDQTPTYTAATTLAELESGEKLSTAFGKLSKAVKDLISHKADKVAHITTEERNAWNTQADTIKNLTTIKNVSVQTNINFNDITIPGLFQYAIQCTTEERNAPELNTIFYIYNICRDSSNMEQFAIAEGKNKLYYRTKKQGTWGVWAEVLTNEHISQNFTTEDWGQIAAAPLVKQLYEENQSLKQQLNNTNTTLSNKKFTYEKETYVSANNTLQTELAKGMYVITFSQQGAWDITGMAFAVMTDTQGSSVCYKICGSAMFLEKMDIALNASDKTMTITNGNGANVVLRIYSI